MSQSQTAYGTFNGLLELFKTESTTFSKRYENEPGFPKVIPSFMHFAVVDNFEQSYVQM